jgi:V-type H+-transporting ATPase subunit H
MGGSYVTQAMQMSRLPVVQGYQRADLITAEELALIKKVDKQSKSRVDSVLLSEGKTYAYLYLSLLKKLQRVDTMQSLLSLIGDALLGDSFVIRIHSS